MDRSLIVQSLPMRQYPLLEGADGAEIHSLPADGSPFLVGRSGKAQLFVASKKCSREQLRLTRVSSGVRLEPLSQHVITQVDEEPVISPVILRHGARISFAGLSWTFLERDPDAPEPEGQDGDALDEAAGWGYVEQEPCPIPVSSGAVLGSDGEGVYRLAHPLVSRRHARILVKGDVVQVEDLESASGTYVNGERVARTTPLELGDRVDLGPFSLEHAGDHLLCSSRREDVELIARGLTWTTRVSGGVPQKLLDDVSLVLAPRQFVAVIGPDGPGKRVLLAALKGSRPAQQGEVLINKAPLYGSLRTLGQGTALVSQDEFLDPGLTVEEALSFRARLLLPRETTTEQLAKIVRRSMDLVDVTPHASQLMRSLSAGERTRAGLACQLSSEPGVVYVDEATNGLGAQADWELMRIFRRLADERGTTVVFATQNTVNVEEFCHKVVVLTGSGALAFYGTPEETRNQFGVDRIGGIYTELAREEGSYWSERYRSSQEFQRHVGMRLEQVDPAPTRPTAAGPRESGSAPALREVLHQTDVLTRRYVKQLMRDRGMLRLALGQSLLVALLVTLAFWSDQGLVREGLKLSVLGLACLWMGASSASKELVRERAGYLREREQRLSVSAYLGSKLAVLGVLGLVQVLLLAAIARATTPALGGGELAFLLLTNLTGIALGLALSAAMRTVGAVTTVLQVALLPQLLLSSMIVPRMDPVVELPARLVVSGYSVCQGMEAGTAWDEGIQESGDQLPLSGSEAGPAPQAGIPAQGGMTRAAAAWTLLAHMGIGLVAALSLLSRRERRIDLGRGRAV